MGVAADRPRRRKAVQEQCVCGGEGVRLLKRWQLPAGGNCKHFLRSRFFFLINKIFAAFPNMFLNHLQLHFNHRLTFPSLSPTASVAAAIFPNLSNVLRPCPCPFALAALVPLGSLRCSHAYETCRLSRHVPEQQKPQQILGTPPPLPSLNTPYSMCFFALCWYFPPLCYPVIIRTLLGFSACFIALSPQRMF